MNFLIDLISLIIAFVIYAFMSNKITKDLNNSEAASLGKLLFFLTVPVIAFLLSIMFKIIIYPINSSNTEVKQIETNDYQNNTVDKYYYKDGFYYIQLEGTDNYVKIPADEINIQ